MEKIGLNFSRCANCDVTPLSVSKWDQVSKAITPLRIKNYFRLKKSVLQNLLSIATFESSQLVLPVGMVNTVMLCK